jgi:imidazole glycerol-phosphate synthase subunit HisH
MRVKIFDYGAGNLHSLAKALAGPSVDIVVEPDPVAAIDTDVLILPGVGAFGAAADRLRPARESMRDAIDAGLPTVGICLGMQLLFERSEEGPGQGLGVFGGEVTALRAKRSPQIGWNTIEPASPGGAGLPAVYYANGFACRPTDESIVQGWSMHEDDRFPAIVRRGRTAAVQFHPEKSSAEGVRWLRELVAEVSR